MRRLLIATSNRDKIREIRSLLAEVPVELITLGDIAPVAEPEETGITFEENARLKARYYGKHSGSVTVAEDSGLVIDALDGEPGVKSARFLRPDASYPERFAAIFERLARHPERPRTARFVCALSVVDGNTIAFETTATVEGLIAPAPAGNHGFGYDPIFYYPPYGATLAEVAEDAKLAVAHRGKAFRKLAGWIHEVGGRSQAVNQSTAKDSPPI
jgi:XTP/dITP diphosphohydrolase